MFVQNDEMLTRDETLRNIVYPDNIVHQSGSSRAARKRQPCVNGDWLCQWEMAIFDPHRIHTPWPITKKIVASNYVGNSYGSAKFGANSSTGGFWANGWIIAKIFHLFIYSLFSWTHLQVTPVDWIFTLDGSNDADSRKDVPFGGFVDIASHFWGKLPQKKQFLWRE